MDGTLVSSTFFFSYSKLGFGECEGQVLASSQFYLPFFFFSSEEEKMGWKVQQGRYLEMAQLLPWIYCGQHFLLPGAVERRVISLSWPAVALAGFMMTSWLIPRPQHTHL